MADLRFEVSAAVQRAAVASRGLTRESAGGQPYFAPEVMMSRFHTLVGQVVVNYTQERPDRNNLQGDL